MQNGGQMEMATPEQVWQMVQALNNSGSSQEIQQQRRAADKWLQDYRRTKGAWATLDQLLRTEGLDETGKFFAAQSMKTKVCKDMHQLAPADRDGLASSLMAHIHTYRHGPLNVRKQLCLAFAAYAGEFDRGAKVDIIQNVCGAFGSSAETVPVLLDLLTLLGEEAAQVQDDQYDCPPGEEHPLLLSARSSALPVLNFTHQCFEGVSPADLKSRGAVVKCFTRWLRFGSVPCEQIVQSPIVHYALTGLKETQCDDLCEASSDLLCELAYISSDLRTGQPIFQLLTSQLGLLQSYHQSAMTSENEILARAVTRVIAEMAERYVHVLREPSPDAINMVNLVVSCASHPDTQISQITYRFWYQLLKALQEEPEHRQRREAMLEPTLLQLLPIFAKSAAFPEDCDDDDWSSSQEDEFRNFRMESLYDAVLDVGETVSPLRCLESFLPMLAAQVDKAGADWRELEGSLFVAHVLARKVQNGGEAAMPALLGLYSKLPEHPRVRTIFTKLIAYCGVWLNSHPQYLGPLLDYVVKGLGLPKQEGGLAAAEALQDLCDDCSEHMASPQQRQGMLNIYAGIDALELPMQEKIVQGVGAILLRIDGKELPGMIASLVETPVQMGTAALQRGDKKGAMDQIKKLRTLMKGGYVAGDRPSDAQRAEQIEALSLSWAQNFQRVWPLLEGVIVSHGDDGSLLEDMCRCIRSAVQVMGLRFRDFLGPFATAAVNAYLKKPLSCILYAVTTVVSTFGKQPEFVQPLTAMIVALSTRTYQEFGSGEAFSEVCVCSRVCVCTCVCAFLCPHSFRRCIPSSSYLHLRGMQHKLPAPACSSPPSTALPCSRCYRLLPPSPHTHAKVLSMFSF